LGREVPCVGCSLGIERVLSLMMEAEREAAKEAGKQIRVPEIDVYICSIGDGEELLRERMRIAARLWRAGIRAELNYALKPKMKRQIEHAIENQIPLMVLVGADEVEQGLIQLKDVNAGQQTAVAMTEMVDKIKENLEQLSLNNGMEKLSTASS